MSEGAASSPLVLRLGRQELVIRYRYEVASVVNDLLIAVWFIVGSVLFFSESTTTVGTWCFLLGSVELALRPAIRLSRHLHLRKLQAATESDQDF